MQLWCTCGWNTADESIQTSIKPDFMIISTFEADKGHSSPRLFCIFMHLWPCSIWLRRDIKAEILQRWLFSQKSASTFLSRGLAAPSNGFGPTVCWGRGGGVTVRETSCLRETLHPLMPLSHHALEVLLGAFLKPFLKPVDVMFSLPNYSSHLTICKLWEMTSLWLSSPSPATHEGKAEAICWCIKPDDQRCRQVTEGNHMGSGCPQIMGYT